MDDLRLNVRLDEQTARDIKSLLWNGSTQDAIAAHYNISQTTVSRIVRGKQWFKAPWPNGDVGPMPREKAIERKVGGDLYSEGRRLTDVALVNPDTPAMRAQISPKTAGPTKIINPQIYADKGAAAPARPTVEKVQAEVELEKKKKALLASDYQRLGEAAEQRAVDDLESAVQTTDNTARLPRDDIKDQTDLNIIPWTDIVKAAPRNNLVKSGLVDATLRPAICQVFAVLPKSEWGKAQARLLVSQTMQILKEEKTDE